jgi:alpha-L-rhamnosidase
MVRETIRKQSWNGKWFCDNAVRQKDGSLKLSGECTETCQYYAFYFRTATPKTHPELWKTLVEDFGPKRKETGKYPKIWPSNAFIGNYLRLDMMAKNDNMKEVLDNIEGYFYNMALTTGTLWENDSTVASLDHGFASHVIVWLLRDMIENNR